MLSAELYFVPELYLSWVRKSSSCEHCAVIPIVQSLGSSSIVSVVVHNGKGGGCVGLGVALDTMISANKKKK